MGLNVKHVYLGIVYGDRGGLYGDRGYLYRDRGLEVFRMVREGFGMWIEGLRRVIEGLFTVIEGLSGESVGGVRDNVMCDAVPSPAAPASSGHVPLVTCPPDTDFPSLLFLFFCFVLAVFFSLLFGPRAAICTLVTLRCLLRVTTADRNDVLSAVCSETRARASEGGRGGDSEGAGGELGVRSWVYLHAVSIYLLGASVYRQVRERPEITEYNPPYNLYRGTLCTRESVISRCNVTPRSCGEARFAPICIVT